MRVALFGGTGFVGSYLVDALVDAGMHPVLLVRAGSDSMVRHREQCTTVAGSIDDEEAVTRTLADADAAIYNIGILREFPDQGISFEALQLDGAVRVIDAAVKADVKRFLLMSANGVKVDGTDYQRTKYLAEQHLDKTDLDSTVFRPSVLFGDPRGRSEFATQLRNDIVNSPLPAPMFFEGVLPLAAGAFQLSPVHVEDVARAFVESLNKPETIKRTLPLGGPASLRWREIIATIAAAVGKRKLTTPAPAWAVSAAAGLMQKWPSFPITQDQIRMLLEGNVCSSESFKLLGFEPRAFDVDTLSYLNNPSDAD